MARRTPSVVLVGRPNVGKSTLFNRITGTRRAIVAPLPGTTRDALSLRVVWRGYSFQLFDTGGMFGESEDPLHELVVRHGQRAIAGADLLVMVVDGRQGLVPADEVIARTLHETNRPILLAINKTDDKRSRHSTMEFYQLGFDPVIEISAEHGLGIGDLLDEVVKRVGTRDTGSQAREAGTATRDAGVPLRESGAGTRNAGSGARESPGAGPEAREVPGLEPRGQSAEGNAPSPESRAPGPEALPQVPTETSVAIVGRPNVGKSSLVNRLLKEERVLVSEMPGTTRDAVDALLTWHRRRFRIVDTAGMRRAGRVQRGGQVEMVSVLGAKRAIEAADVVGLVIDASAGATDQDAAIGGEADKAGRGIVIVVNKWDLVKGRGPEFVKTFDDELRRRMKFLDYAPILHISALTGERAPKVLETIDRVAAARRQRIPTPQLNRFVEAITSVNPPVSPTRKHVRVLYCAQIGVAPPFFVFFTNVATTFHFSYERFLVNQLRESFGFIGTPIRIQVRRRKK